MRGAAKWRQSSYRKLAVHVLAPAASKPGTAPGLCGRARSATSARSRCGSNAAQGLLRTGHGRCSGPKTRARTGVHNLAALFYTMWGFIMSPWRISVRLIGRTDRLRAMSSGPRRQSPAVRVMGIATRRGRVTVPGTRAPSEPQPSLRVALSDHEIPAKEQATDPARNRKIRSRRANRQLFGVQGRDSARGRAWC